MRGWYFLLLLSIAVVPSVGCSGGGSSARAKAKYRIAVIPKGMSHEFWQSIHRGAERAASDLQAQGIPIEVAWDGPLTEDDSQAQVNIVQKQVGTRASGIVLAPQHSKTMINSVEQAVDAGIPVVIIDSGLEKPELYVQYVATDNYHGGRLAAEHLIKVCKEGGKPAPRLILLRYAVGSESTERREQGFLDVISEYNEKQKASGQPGVNLISSDQYAGATASKAQSVAEPLLTRFQDQVDGIFAPNESSAQGVLNSLVSKDLVKKVYLVGFDSSGPLVQAVREGNVHGLVVQDPYRMGYLGVYVLVQYLEGKRYAPDQKYVSTGETVLTKENLDAAEIRGLFDPESQQKRTIKIPEFLAAK